MGHNIAFYAVSVDDIEDIKKFKKCLHEKDKECVIEYMQNYLDKVNKFMLNVNSDYFDGSYTSIEESRKSLQRLKKSIKMDVESFIKQVKENQEYTHAYYYFNLFIGYKTYYFKSNWFLDATALSRHFAVFSSNDFRTFLADNSPTYQNIIVKNYARTLPEDNLLLFEPEPDAARYIGTLPKNIANKLLKETEGLEDKCPTPKNLIYFRDMMKRLVEGEIYVVVHYVY